MKKVASSTSFIPFMLKVNGVDVMIIILEKPRLAIAISFARYCVSSHLFYLRSWAELIEILGRAIEILGRARGFSIYLDMYRIKCNPQYKFYLAMYHTKMQNIV